MQLTGIVTSFLTIMFYGRLSNNYLFYTYQFKRVNFVRNNCKGGKENDENPDS